MLGPHSNEKYPIPDNRKGNRIGRLAADGAIWFVEIEGNKEGGMKKDG